MQGFEFTLLASVFFLCFLCFFSLLSSFFSSCAFLRPFSLLSSLRLFCGHSPFCPQILPPHDSSFDGYLRMPSEAQVAGGTTRPGRAISKETPRGQGLIR